MMRRGSTRGAMISARIAVRPVRRWRTRTKAAAVPSAAASHAVRNATMKERMVAATQPGEERYVLYQRREKPCGGNSMKVPDVKETGITNRDGRQRKAMMRSPTVQRIARETPRCG